MFTRLVDKCDCVFARLMGICDCLFGLGFAAREITRKRLRKVSRDMEPGGHTV